MNSNFINSQSRRIKQSRQATPSLKLIVFSIGCLNLALRIESVYKVFKQIPICGSGINPVGVAQVDDCEITVLDLYRQFFKSSPPSDSSPGGYLVTVQNTAGELYGIPVANTPILMEVPLSLLRVLPESYRRGDTLDIASHVAVIPQETSPLTLFLLDVELLRLGQAMELDR